MIVNGRQNGHTIPCVQCPLRNCAALRPFTPSELAFIQELKTDELCVETGVTFLHEGASSKYLYSMLGGWAFRYKMLPDGRRQILNYALPADLIGLQGSLLREMEHSVEALTQLRLCMFPRDKLWDLYSKFPSLAFDVTWLAAREEQLLDDSLLSVGRRTALERTAYVLLHLFQRAKEVGLTRNGAIQFPFTQQHLADTLGMSLVHTNKTLRRLMASQAVSWKDRVFEIHDLGELQRIAGDEGKQRPQRPFL
jgi:CRP/FNR family transcriptional regulator, anaerobic regulatory protein